MRIFLLSYNYGIIHVTHMTHQEFIAFLGKLTSLPENERSQFMQLSIELPVHERSRIADHLLRINGEMHGNELAFADRKKKIESEMNAMSQKDIPDFLRFAAQP